MDNYSKAIGILRRIIRLDENITVNDFKAIWHKIQNLPPQRLRSREDLAKLVAQYFYHTYKRHPRFQVTAGVDLTPIQYYLQLIKKEVEKNK